MWLLHINDSLENFAVLTVNQLALLKMKTENQN